MRPAEPYRGLEAVGTGRAERDGGSGATFHAVLDAARRRGALVVQPRMGFSDPARMRAGLGATKAANATTVGTLTLDSFTRVGDFATADRALRERRPLNGYPIVNFPTATTEAMLAGIRDRHFPVQVRHGSSLPGRIIDALIEAGLDATEGGPISYCLPYSRTPIGQSVQAWQEACEKLATLRERGVEPHLESFGGCMLGQLCPPSLLIAITVLEGLFFRRHGLRSISLSYAQGPTRPRTTRPCSRCTRSPRNCWATSAGTSSSTPTWACTPAPSPARWAWWRTRRGWRCAPVPPG